MREHGGLRYRSRFMVLELSRPNSNHVFPVSHLLWNTIGDKITARKLDCSVRVLCWWSSSIRQIGFLVRELGFLVRELSSSDP